LVTGYKQVTVGFS